MGPFGEEGPGARAHRERLPAGEVQSRRSSARFIGKLQRARVGRCFGARTDESESAQQRAFLNRRRVCEFQRGRKTRRHRRFRYRHDPLGH